MEYKKSLSASSIKSLETCSWLYWCQYEHKMPQRSNEGAMRGTCVHTIFECLLNERHKKHYDIIMQAGSINASPAVRRLVIKHLRQDDILTTTNYEMIDAMILVGLKSDFFGLGYGAPGTDGFIGEPEYRFEIENKEPFYKVRGYIDKIVFYKGGRIKIVDYKSSKQKFSGDDLEANVQSMVYSLAGYKILGATDVTTEFIFLRYPRQPIQAVHITKKQLEGFEHYLAYIYELINNYTIKNAKENMAAYNDKNRWLCKAGAWTCPYLRGFTYYALRNKDGSIARTSMENDLEPQPEQKLEVLKYEGCPAHQRRGSL